jgi:Spherulation-specific family 4/PEP-CTERM motif
VRSRGLTRFGVATALGIMVSVLGCLSEHGQARADVIVPAYFYPSGSGLTDWNTLTASASQVQETVIANPDSGPGTTVDPNYTAVINPLRAAGAQVVGYIATGYGVSGTAGYQTLQSAENQVVTWNTLYHIDGIFIDQMSTDPTLVSSYYAPLYNFIKEFYPTERVIGNPGTNPPQSYLAAADTLVTYENNNATSPYASYTPPSYSGSYAPSHFANIIYNVPTVAAMQTIVAEAAKNGVGSVYVTDEATNTYSSLPSYWDQEVAALSSSVPEPSMLVLAGVGSVLVLAAGIRQKHRIRVARRLS